MINLESCDELAPKCSFKSEHLVDAASDLLNGSVVKFGDKSSKVQNFPWSDIHFNSNSTLRRPKRTVAGLPPLITIGGDDNDCTRCEVVNTVCAIFNLGMILVWISSYEAHFFSGSFKICTLAILAGPAAPIACNLIATPARIGCLINTLKCFKEGCGAVRFVRLQTVISECMLMLILQDSQDSCSRTWKEE